MFGGERAQVVVLRVRVDTVRAVGRVGEQNNPALGGEAKERFQFISAQDRAERVDRIADEDHLRAGGDRLDDVIRVKAPAVWLPEPDEHRLRSRKANRRHKVEVTRVGHDDLVAGVQARKRRVGDPSLSAFSADHLKPVVARSTEEPLSHQVAKRTQEVR